MENKDSVPSVLTAFFDNIASQELEVTEPMQSLAREIVSLGPAPTSSSIVLDNACGTGIITDEVLRRTNATGKIYAADVSQAMIDALRNKNLPNVESDVMDAQELKHSDNIFTHSYTHMAIFLFPQAEKAAAEIYRTLRPGGTAIITSIKKTGWVEFFQQAQKTVRPHDEEWPGPLSPEWRTGETKLRSVVEGGGFAAGDIQITECTRFITMADLPPEMIAAMAQIIALSWPDEQKAEFKTELQRLIDEDKPHPQSLEIAVWVAIAKK